MSALTLIYKALAFNDAAATSNPVQSPIDWSRTISNISVDNPGTQSYPIDPLAALVILDGTRATSIDNISAFSLALSSLEPTRYRVKNTGGTAPAFRTDRALVVTSILLSIAVNSNQTATVTAGSGTPFSGVLVGDVVFIPGISTGDTISPFNTLNEGYWKVLSASSTILTIARNDGEVFSGSTEAVTPSSDIQFQAFSAAGVQVGDTVKLGVAWAAPARHSYDVVAVNPFWVEFESSAPLGPQTGIEPTNAGLAFYTRAKRFILIETDQEISVRLNGDTGDSNAVEPLVPGDAKFIGSFLKVGTVWKLEVVNQSSTVANVLVISAE